MYESQDDLKRHGLRYQSTVIEGIFCYERERVRYVLKEVRGKSGLQYIVVGSQKLDDSQQGLGVKEVGSLETLSSNKIPEYSGKPTDTQSLEIKPFRVGLGDDKEQSLDTTRRSDGLTSAEILRDKTPDFLDSLRRTGLEYDFEEQDRTDFSKRRHNEK